MRDLIPEWIANYERFQEMPLELSAYIDEFLDRHPGSQDIEETRQFLVERYAVLQEQIDKLRAASLSGSKVLLAGEGG